VRTARLYPVGEGADHAEKKKLFEQDKLSIHIYALSPTPVKVRLLSPHLDSLLIA
jgi:hypothetical protein